MIRDFKYIIKKVIIGFLVGMLLFLFKGYIVHAEDSPDWLDNAKYTFNAVNFVNFPNSSSVQWRNITYYNLTTNDGRMYPTWRNSLSDSIANNGVMWLQNVAMRLEPNYMYSYSLYFCSSKNLEYANTNTELYISGSASGLSQRPSNSVKFQKNNITKLSDSPVWETDISLSNCRVITSLFVPSSDGSWVGTKFTSKSGTINDVIITFLGYNIEMVGVYDKFIQDSIQNSINTSGFATATSVQQVQSSVNQVKQEIQGMQQKQEQTNQKLDELNDNITSEDIDTSGYGNLSNNNANNGVINQLVTMPITLAQAYLNGFNSSCSPFSLGTLYGEELILPCINPQNYLGNIWSIIDVIVSGVFVFVFGKKLVKIFNDVTNLKENQVNEVFD